MEHLGSAVTSLSALTVSGFPLALIYNGKKGWRAKLFYVSAQKFAHDCVTKLEVTKRTHLLSSLTFQKGLQVAWISLINSLSEDYSLHSGSTSMKRKRGKIKRCIKGDLMICGCGVVHLSDLIIHQLLCI